MKELIRMGKAYPTGFDMWLAVIAILIGFDKHVPWWVYGLAAVEFIAIVALAVAAKMENK